MTAADAESGSNDEQVEQQVARIDPAYGNDRISAGEYSHRYGERLTLLATPFLLTQLAELCSPDTVQPRLNQLVESCYRQLMVSVLDREFPRTEVTRPTRMSELHAGAAYHGAQLDRETRAVVVDIARAGILPAHVTFQLLSEVLNPANVRQDHLVMNRLVDRSGQVTGVGLSGSKVGGSIDHRIVVVPDPMGATGGSVVRAIQHYEASDLGRPELLIMVHLIVTPNYLRRVWSEFPEARIYAIRVDRGLSEAEVLEQVPGEAIDRENGLDRRQYIVPGAGGLGEVFNNAWV